MQSLLVTVVAVTFWGYFFALAALPSLIHSQVVSTQIEILVDGQISVLSVHRDNDVRKEVVDFCAQSGIGDVQRCAKTVYEEALRRVYWDDSSSSCSSRSVLIVAHPDDETIFGYDTIANGSEQGECWTVICVTAGYDAERRSKFTTAMRLLRSQLARGRGRVARVERFEIWNYFTCVDCIPFQIYVPGERMFRAHFGDTVVSDLKVELQRYVPRRIVTHNAQGDYGHAQHKALHIAVLQAARELDLDLSGIHVFQPYTELAQIDANVHTINERTQVLQAYGNLVIKNWGNVHAKSVPLHEFDRGHALEWCMSQNRPMIDASDLECGDTIFPTPAAAPLRVLNGLYLGWLTEYNAGDHLLYHVAAQLFAQRASGFSGISVALTWHHPPVPCDQYRINVESYDFLILGGGTILSSQEYGCMLRQAAEASVPVFAFGTGWSQQKSEPSVGVGDEQFMPSIALSLSRRNEATATCTLGRVAAYAHGGVRGPISMAALRSNAAMQGVPSADLERRMRILGDAGMLYPVHSKGDLLRNELLNYFGGAECAEESTCSSIFTRRPLVAVNFGGHEHPGEFILHSDIEQVSRAYVGLLNYLAATDAYSVVVYVNHGKDLQYVRYLLDHVTESPNVVFYLRVFDATSMFELLSLAKYCVNYKLHASVSCTRAGVPSLDIPYTKKYNDWAAFSGVPNVVVSTDLLEEDSEGRLLQNAFEKIVGMYDDVYGDMMDTWRAVQEQVYVRTLSAYSEAIDMFLGLIVHGL